MPDGKALLEHLLYQVKDRDAKLVVAAVWLPPESPSIILQQVLVSVNDILALHPQPLPDLPPAPDPLPDPETPPEPKDPPAPPIERMGVQATNGLSIRAAPSIEAAKRAQKLIFNDMVDVQGDIPGGAYRWTKLIRINELKYQDIGYVAIGKADGSETYLVKV